MGAAGWCRKQEEPDRKPVVVVAAAGAAAEQVPGTRDWVVAAHEAESSSAVQLMDIHHQSQNLVLWGGWRCIRMWVVVELGVAVRQVEGNEAHEFAGARREKMHLQEAADAKSLAGIATITAVPPAERGLAGQRTRGPDSWGHRCRHQTWLPRKRRKQKKKTASIDATLGSRRFMIGRLVSAGRPFNQASGAQSRLLKPNRHRVGAGWFAASRGLLTDNLRALSGQDKELKLSRRVSQGGV